MHYDIIKPDSRMSQVIIIPRSNDVNHVFRQFRSPITEPNQISRADVVYVRRDRRMTLDHQSKLSCQLLFCPSFYNRPPWRAYLTAVQTGWGSAS